MEVRRHSGLAVSSLQDLRESIHAKLSLRCRRKTSPKAETRIYMVGPRTVGEAWVLMGACKNGQTSVDICHVPTANALAISFCRIRGKT